MVLLFLCIVSLLGQGTSKPQFPPELTPLSTSINNLHITSHIQLRYARTFVKSRIKNQDSEARKVQFSLIIPDSAFISNFSMVTTEGEFVADVEGKEEAEKNYQVAVEDGRGVGLVSQEISRDSNKFRVSTNVPAGQEVLFKLTYEELLERKNGLYEHILNINPGQVVEDLKIDIFINESLPITSLSVPKLIESNEVDFSRQEQDNDVAVVTKQVDGDPRKAQILFQPDRTYQEEAGHQGVAGQLVVRYDVDRAGQDSEVQVLDGYFVHYFVPDNLETLARHSIFILDVSGSMGGEKLNQLKDAMFTVLNQMSEQDLFNIVTFSSGVNHWQGGKVIAATKENKRLAIAHVLGLQANGGTNINQALLEGLQVVKLAMKTEKLQRQMSSMVVFLTDGLATEGEQNKELIKTNIKEANKDLDVSIFCLAFGRDADFDLVKDISLDAKSFAKNIYEGSDAAIQLEGFYSQISSPLITNLKFSYVGGLINRSSDAIVVDDSVGGLVDNSSVSDTELKTFFKGGQYVVAGKLKKTDHENQVLSVKVTGESKNGKYEETIVICLRPSFGLDTSHSDLSLHPLSLHPGFCISPTPVYSPRSKDQQFLQKLHAFLNVKQLLSKEDPKDQETALQLALLNNFVTPVTSLLVQQPGEQPCIHLLQDEVDISEDYQASFSTRGGGGGAGGGYTLRSGSGGGLAYSLDYDRTLLYSSPVAADYADEFGSYDYDIRSNEELDSETTTSVPCFGNLTLYNETYHRGKQVTLEDMMILSLGEMDNESVSVKVSGTCCWRLYAEPLLVGFSKLVSGGEDYKSVTSLGSLFREVSSVRQEPCWG